MVFVMALLVAVVLAPLTWVPAMFEEHGVLAAYARYLEEVATFGWIEDRGAWIWAAVMAAWAGTQVVFLSPLVGAPQLDSRGRSLVPSIVAAAVLGSLGCALLWVAMIEGAFAVVATVVTSVGEGAFNNRYEYVMGWGYSSALAVWIGCGFAWYLLLAQAGGTRDPAGLGRFVRWLLAGTCVELVLGVACYLAVRKRTDCYCAMASFWSIVFGVATLLWLCGPWTVLLLTRRERLAWVRGACRRCGYPRRSGGAVCSECGAALEDEGAAKQG